MAAIVTASVALLLLLLVLVRYLIKRSAPPSQAATYLPRSSYTTSPYGSDFQPNSSSSNVLPNPYKQSPISASPSTDHTTLVTPSSSSGGHLPYPSGNSGAGGGGRYLKKKGEKRGRELSPIVVAPPLRMRPETEEMVMVTYEEGLQKLRMRPHHSLYPEGLPQSTDFDGQMSPMQGGSPGPGMIGNPRITPGRQLGGRSPAAPPRGMGGRSPTPDPGSDVGPGEVESTWLPGYYHTARRDERERDSELVYHRHDGNRI